VAVLREQGVNSHVEMAYAFIEAGFEALDVHMTDLQSGRANLADFRGLVACGGFSYGDTLGAGIGGARSITFNQGLADQFGKHLAMNLADWIGRTETVCDTATPTPYAALSATFDREASRPAPGTPLPPLWHWLYFLPIHRLCEIGIDGHAQRGGFLPPVPLPRRMWAGSQFTFHKPLRVGDVFERTSTIADVSEKSGRTGRLVFVKVRHEIRCAGESDMALTEFHDIVYREAAGSDDVPVPPKAVSAMSVWEKRWVPDDVLLFRYSALTFNSHRIHYDRKYVTEVEGYPGLIVHGPLVATLLLDLLRHHMPDAHVLSYEFRALRPMFDIHPFFVCGEPQLDGKTIHLWAKDHEGWLTMDATAFIV
jgi:3-methylfumaryl-CoA hydratase